LADSGRWNIRILVDKSPVSLELIVLGGVREPARHRRRQSRMKLSKYLCAVALIMTLAGCQGSAKGAGGGGSSSGSTAATTSSATSAAPAPSLPPPTPLKRVAELSYSGGFVVGNGLAVPVVAAYSDGTVVITGHSRLTLTPGALAVLVSTLQQDLKGQPTTTVLQPRTGHGNPDGASTVVAVYQPGGTYQSVYALGLGASTASQYPAGVADAFTKLQALTSDQTTSYTSTKVRYSVKCPTDTTSPVKPWPSAIPQPGAGQQDTCLEVKTVDGPVAAAVRAACLSLDSSPGQPPRPVTTTYRSARGLRICQWRLALPDEAS
jgi:hypothetical protein